MVPVAALPFTVSTQKDTELIAWRWPPGFTMTAPWFAAEVPREAPARPALGATAGIVGGGGRLWVRDAGIRAAATTEGSTETEAVAAGTDAFGKGAAGAFGFFQGRNDTRDPWLEGVSFIRGTG